MTSSFFNSGPLAKYLGQGDQHDPVFEYLKVSSRLDELNAFRVNDSTYMGAPFNKDLCPYTITVYPANVY